MKLYCYSCEREVKRVSRSGYCDKCLATGGPEWTGESVQELYERQMANEKENN